MIDLLTATQDAVFAALENAVDPDLAAVYQHIPEGAVAPFIIVGDIEAEAYGGKDAGLERQTVEIGFIYEGEDRRQLLAMMHAAREALDGQPIEADGATLSAPSWLSSVTSAADGTVIYDSSQRYEIIAQPAD